MTNVSERRLWVNFEGSNVVHPVTYYDIAVNEVCPNCGPLITGNCLERFEPVGQRVEAWVKSSSHIRFIKEPTGRGKYRFCKSRRFRE